MLKFPDNFIWGAATSSYQIEGAYDIEGKGESIWDRFSHTPGRIKTGETGDIACDHYHRLTEDIELMKQIGLQAYRFSVSWPRVFPAGSGTPNLKGIDFYKRLADALLEAGIRPFITLYHWDLPQKLQDKGGWLNRDICAYFADYAAYVFDKIGDTDHNWITLNEPAVSAYCGYQAGFHAPGIKDTSKAVQVMHNLLLAHGKAVEVFRDSSISGRIGISLNLSPIDAASDDPAAMEAAARRSEQVNDWFLDPIFKGEYPDRLMTHYRKRYNAPVIHNSDLALIKAPIDFLGLNYYTRELIASSKDHDKYSFNFIRPEKSKYSMMNWEIYPPGIFNILIYTYKVSRDIPIYITENGTAVDDIPLEDGSINDMERIDYLGTHIAEVHRAIESGIPVNGYFVWSLMDNFEWAEGFSRRFGISYIDYSTLKRTLKKSAFFYSDVIQNKGLT